MGANNTKYRVEWISKVDGQKGFGTWMEDLAAVTRMMNEQNAEWPEIEHKIGYGYNLPKDAVGCEICGATMDKVDGLENYICPSCGWHG